MYQVLWLRTLGWVFGVTTYAASTVWATFMTGLAVGSLAAGIVADRVKHPLRWFASCEVLIGLSAAASPALLQYLQGGYAALYPRLPHSLPALTAARGLMAFATLIVPTALMGATLPLVVKGSGFRHSQLGRRIGLLYGSNTAGAILGTLVAGLYLIPYRGIHGAFVVAAIINVAVGATAWLLSLRAPPNAPAPRGRDGRLHASAPAAASVAGRGTNRGLAVVLTVFTLSGATSLALEVVWFRVLTLFLRPTVYGFAVMLATILSGIALGSYIATPLVQRRARWVAVLGGLEVAIAVTVTASFASLAWLPRLSDAVTPLVARVLPDYLGYPLAGSLLTIFPTALLMGIAFPIGLHVWTIGDRGDGSRSASRLSTFYALNVAGGIVGSLAAGFLLLPLLGSPKSLMLLGTVTLLGGLALLRVSELARTTRLVAMVGATAVFAAVLAAAPNPFAEFIAQRYAGDEILSVDEGVEATVLVQRTRNGDLSLTVNGNHQASSDDTTTYVHRRIGHFPMALHPNARTALVIGLGGGATAGAVSIHTGVQVDVVELAGSVVRASSFFERGSYGVLRRPNVTLRVDDGRNYLMLTPRRYDIITADVIHPIYAGSGNLYSREYFELMKRVLNPGGMVLQWISGTEAEYKSIARTFLSVFPEATVWLDGTVFVGSLEPLKLRRADFDWKLEVPGRAQGLHDLNIESFDRLLSFFVAGPDDLRRYLGTGPILTDDRPLTEYFLSLPRDRDPDLSSLKGDVRRYVTD
jgi:spermidine synthase